MMAWISIAVLAGANMYNQAFDQANAAYDAGDYQTAIDAYEQLISESVVHPVVFFNLGNAYYRSGCLGAAVANYERALQLNPRAEDARENLDKCVRETKQQLARPRPPDWEQSLLFWHYNLPPRVTRLTAIILWFLFWSLLAVRLVRPIRFFRHAALGVGLLALAFGLSAWTKAHTDLYAVAVDEQVPVHYGTSEDETVRFYLYAGDRVLVDRREKGWARVMTSDDERGWVKQDALALVGPPYERPRPPRPATGNSGGVS
jgi:tetratricopeptide (TPR) repeat protein